MRENVNNTVNYYVFTITGEPFAGGDQYLTPASVFAQKYPDLKLDEITGWADGTLLILNSNKGSGDQGPSFWFDLGSKTIIQLSRRFN